MTTMTRLLVALLLVCAATEMPTPERSAEPNDLSGTLGYAVERPTR